MFRRVSFRGRWLIMLALMSALTSVTSIAAVMGVIGIVWPIVFWALIACAFIGAVFIDSRPASNLGEVSVAPLDSSVPGNATVAVSAFNFRNVPKTANHVPQAGEFELA